MKASWKFFALVPAFVSTFSFFQIGWSLQTKSLSEHLSRTFSQAITFKNITDAMECLKKDPDLVHEELPGGDTPLIAVLARVKSRRRYPRSPPGIGLRFAALMD